MLSVAAAGRQYLESGKAFVRHWTKHESTDPTIFGRREGVELTSWPPALCLLLYIVVVLTIY